MKYQVSYPVLIEKINDSEYSFKVEIFEDKIDPVYSDDIVSGLLEIKTKIRDLLKFYILDNIEFPKFEYPNMLNGCESKFYNIISFDVEINEDDYENINIHISKETYKKVYPLLTRGWSISELITLALEEEYK